MAITSGIKFFKESKTSGALASSLVSGSSTVDNILNTNKETFYRSSGSSDSIIEDIQVQFSEEKIIDRIFLIDINFKEFDIMYDASGVWTHFSNVIDVDGSQSNVTEADYDKDTYYCEFASVSTSKIRIRATKTQIADAEKYLNQFIATEEIGTFVGYPEVKKIDLNRQLRSTKTISGKHSIQKSLETIAFNLQFTNYPSSDVYNIDIDLVLELHDSETPFLAWLCGGKFGSPCFNYTLRGYRLKDVLKVQVSNSYQLSYTDSVTVNPLNVGSINLVEHI